MIDQLKTIVGDNAIYDSGNEISKYVVAGKIPSILVFPTTVEQISKIMKLAQREKKKISIFGNNSECNFGAAIESFDLGISLNRMNKILSHEVADLTVTVEAGMNLAALQQSLKSKKQFLPLDPVNAENRTLGGIVSANSSGPWRLRYGVCRDLVLGLKVVQPDGTVIRTGGKTVKNVAGYDLSKLFIGSIGTLGVITEITFKLFPLPADSLSICVGFNSFERIPGFARAISSSKLIINRCEYFNRIFASEHFSDIIEFSAPHVLIFDVQGNSAMVTTTVQKLQEMAHDAGAIAIQSFREKDESKFWNQINQADCQNTCLHIQIAVPRSCFGDVVTSAEKVSTEQKSPAAIQSHAGNGIVNLFWNGAIDGSHDLIENWRSTIKALRQSAESYGGSLTVHHAPIALRSPELVWGEEKKSFALMKAIKSKYDVYQVIAGGRFLGGL
jgi:glycolate oxidase FAD binding subunit